MKLDSQQVLALVDRLIAQAAPGELPALAAALSARAGTAAARLLEHAKPTIPPPRTKDRLLNVEQAAQLLNTTPQWLYRRSKNLPFTRKLSRKLLRFSEKGIYRWLDSRS